MIEDASKRSCFNRLLLRMVQRSRKREWNSHSTWWNMHVRMHTHTRETAHLTAGTASQRGNDLVTIATLTSQDSRYLTET